MTNLTSLLENSGVNVSLNTQQEIILKQSKLDWTVRTEKLVTESGIETPNIAIVRNDNNRILGVHKSGYQAIQNSEVLDILFKLSNQSGLQLHKGGEMKQGELIYFQLKSNDMYLGTDKIVGSITGINSHNGSTCIGFGNTNTTISCMNTLYMAYKELSHKIKHTANMQIKIDILLHQLDRVLENEKTIFAKIKRLNEIQMDAKTKDLVVKAVLGLGKNDRLTDGDFSTRKQNILNDLERNILHQTKEKGETLWGLLSGITRYSTHDIKGSKVENKILGAYGKKDQLVFDMLTKEMTF